MNAHLRAWVLASLFVGASGTAAAMSAPWTPSEVWLGLAAQADDEEEEEEEEAAPSGPGTQGPSTDRPEADPAQQPATTLDPRAYELVSGAPLYNPNVAVHIVQKKQFADVGRHELALYPGVAQVNGKFTQHYGTALSYTYHLHENFGIQLTPQWNWFTSESGFNQELITKVREEAQAASSLLLTWGALLGVEVTPLYGKFAFYEENMAHFSLVVNGGAGYGATRHQLKPENDAGPATFGETGNRVIGSVGGGFRVQIGNNFALRLEVRDLVYTARVEQVNGCNAEELQIMNDRLNRNQPLVGANGAPAFTVRNACQVDKFVQDDQGNQRSADVPLALSLVRNPTSDVLNLVSFYAGFAYLF